jgi:hydrogenase-4 component F
VTLVAFVLILVGLASKIGWAPVHNWLPDAHSEAPPPVSAMLSAALLPTVLLIAWRTKLALEPALGVGTMQELFIGFGLASLLVAIPFLWRPLPWKRLLAYSSLEHMGILALGIGFGTPLAIAGVIVHVAGHGLAKALGFYTAIPLLRQDPSTAESAPRGIVRTSAPTAAAMSVSLLTLAGLPPSPLFVSEVMILLGGMDAGLIAVSSIAAVMLALGFLGLAHALLEGLLGEGKRSRRPTRSVHAIALLAGAAALALLGLTVVAYALPGSDIVDALMRSGA